MIRINKESAWWKHAPYISVTGIFLLILLQAVPGSAQTLSGKGKNWQVNFKTQFIHNSNLSQKPEDQRFITPLFPTNHDSGLNWNANGTYVHTFSDRLRVTANYDIDMTNWDDSPAYDTLTQMFGFKPSFKINNEWFASAQYFFIWNLAGGFDLVQDSFSTVQYLNPAINHMSKKWGLTRLGLRYSYNKNYQTNARDNHTVGFTLDHMYQIKKGMMVGGGYGFRSEDTSLPGFERDVHDFKIKLKTALAMGIDFLGEYRFSLRDYKNNFSAPRNFLLNQVGTFERRDAQHNFTLELRKLLFSEVAFIRNVRANMKWVRQDNESNFNFREFTSNFFSGGVTAQF